MDRRDKALHFLDLDGRGIEIGPSYNPLLPKAGGAHVETVDHADRETLVEKYRELGLVQEHLDRIESVDHIWTGGSLLKIIPEHGAYDYVVASHFIEHTTDLILFLNDVEALLKPTGRLALVVPDKRFCFDRFQPLSTIGDIVDAHHSTMRFHPAGSLLDHQAYACKRGEAIGWSPGDAATLRLQFPQLEWGKEVVSDGLLQDSYRDIHRWKFTPAWFQLLIHDLRQLEYHSFGVVGTFDTDGFEFYVTLGKDADADDLDRTAALLEVERELAAVGLGVSDPHTAATAGNSGSTALEERNRWLEAELQRMQVSRSWQVTRPLRAVPRVVRKLRSVLSRRR